jgi:hypothetical protein
MTITKTFSGLELYIVDFTVAFRGGIGNPVIGKENFSRMFVRKLDMLSFVQEISDDECYENVKVSYAPIQIDLMNVREYKFEEIE